MYKTGSLAKLFNKDHETILEHQVDVWKRKTILIYDSY